MITDPSQTLSTWDFQPAIRQESRERVSRPSLSYWQDAWRRLKMNLRAVISIYVVALLLLLAVLGPVIWPVDPARQVLDKISQPPSWAATAVLVDDYTPWDGETTEPVATEPEALGAPERLTVIGLATTEGVRLRWNPVPGADAYEVYRHELVPSSINDLGLPLATLGDGTMTWYEDRLGLQPVRYYYSVVALRDGIEAPRYSTVATSLEPALSLGDAIERGLISAGDPAAVPGKRIRVESHPLGTDYLGRDMLSRTLHGARTSLFIGIAAPALYVLFGLIYGAVAGYLGGWVDNVLMRFADFVIALPFLLFMILFKIAFGIGPGESGIIPMLVAMVVLQWPGTARLVRGQVLQIREEAYIQAARLMGARTRYLLLRHLTPNVMGVLLISLTYAVPSAIFTEAFLSFIGMGVVPPTPSWGAMCQDGLRTMLSHPHELIVPAAFISITVLAFNLLGDGLRDALDARLRDR